MSNRRLAHTYTLQAEFAGAGDLVADLYPLYPRAFLWAHLDDGIMEGVTTNWGNEGIYMEGVGPSLVGRVIPGLGPLQQIYLGGALYFDGNGNLSYDPTALQTQIAQLQGQVTALQAQAQADETNYNAQLAALTARIVANETAITSLQATVFSLQNQIYQINQSAVFKPTANVALAGSGALTAALCMPTSLAAPVMQASGNLQAMIGFQLPIAAVALAATGSIQAAALGVVRNIGAALSGQAAMSGAGTPNVNLIQTLSTFKQLTPIQMAGSGASSTGTLIQQIAIVAQAAGSGGLSLVLNQNIPLALSLTSASSLSASLLQKSPFISALLTGAGSATISAAGFTVLPGVISTWDPANTSSLVTLSNANKTATSNSTSLGSTRGSKGQNSSKLYFEVTAQQFSRAQPSVGVCNAGFTLTNSVGGDTNSFGISVSGSVWQEFYNSVPGLTSSALAAGDIIGVAVDFTTSPIQIFMHRNGTWFNGSGPAGTPDNSTFSNGTTLYPVASLSTFSTLIAQCTINTGGSAFAYTMPSGYFAWR